MGRSNNASEPWFNLRSDEGYVSEMVPAENGRGLVHQ